ncbi:MAG: lysophospholipid acyltransferase family protein [Ktedonobacteraceae bacterium]
MLYEALRAVFWVFTHLICRFRVSGREYVPIKGPLLIIANHLSWYDPLLIGVVLPRRVWFFTKIEIFRWPIVGLLCRLTGQVPVNRGAHDRAALEKGLAYLHEGKALMIFPEGAVEKQERMIPAHTGTAMLAMRTGVAVLPIALYGTRRILRSFRTWLPNVDIEIGKPYVTILPSGVSRKAGLQFITEDMMTRIAEMLPEEQRGLYVKVDPPNA